MPAQGAVFEGKSKEEAVSRGLKELRLDRSDVYIEVVEEGASGFLGFGSRPYRVRLIPRARRSERPSGERPSSGRRPRERPVGRGGREPDRGRGERGGPVARRAGRPGADAGPRERERPDQGGGRQRRGRREDRRRSAVGPPRSEPYPRRPPAAEAAARREPLERAPRSDRPEMLEAPTTPPDAAIVERARQLASELFEQMGFEARVAASAGEDRVSVAVEVDQDEELLTGRNLAHNFGRNRNFAVMANRALKLHSFHGRLLSPSWHSRAREY